MKKILELTIHNLNKILSIYNYKVIVKKTNKKLQFTNFSDFEKKATNKILDLTMVSKENIEFIISAINYLNKNKIQGDYAETGVWRGGLSILSYQIFNHLSNIKRNFFLYDTFEGMPKPSKFDKKRNKNSKDVLGKWKKSLSTDEGWNYASINDVKKNIINHCGKNSIKRFKMIKGKVENTLKIKNNLPKRISLLRLDTDFYNSTKAELKYLFNIVSDGGIIIFDDYSNWFGAKKVIDKFFKDKKYFLIKIDNNSRFIIK
jgi:O-methyltransferase